MNHRMSNFAGSLFLLLAAGRAAVADDCAALGGLPVGGECEISTVVTRSGTFNLSETLHILGNGKIVVPPAAAGNTLTINIDGDLVMDLPSAAGRSQISGDVASGVGATIEINTTGDILLNGDGTTGAAITSNDSGGDCKSSHGGKIHLTAGGKINTEGGTVISTNAKCSAGEIKIFAPLGTIDIDGQVLSQSELSGTGAKQAPGGGPITIEASCKLTISDTGVVSSRGRDPGADLVHLKACQVLIIGLVESSGVGHAVPNSPVNHCNSANRPGKPPNSTGCVEVWAGDSLEIVNGGGNNGEINADTGGQGGSTGTSWIDLFATGNIRIAGDGSQPFVVHAAGNAGTNDDGGTVTVKSIAGQVETSGLAIAANALGAGGQGGSVDVEAGGNPAGDVSFTDATIEARGSTAGNGPAGGDITGRSFNARVAGQAPGKLDAGGGNPLTGSVTLEACIAVAYNGTVIPALTPQSSCGGAPLLPAGYPISLPPGNCDTLCEGPGPGGPSFCLKSTVLQVLDPLDGRFPGNKGPDTVVKAHEGESIQAAVDAASDTNGDGYIIVLVVANAGGLLGGHVDQNVAISKMYPLPFALIGCSVTLHDPKPADNIPTAAILPGAGSPANIFVMDLHAASSGVAGWKVEGDGRYLRNIKTTDNAVGFWIAGNGNTLRNSSATGSAGVGIEVHGDGNLLSDNDAFDNGDHGIEVVGNGNTLLKNDVGDRGKGNGGDGINVAGAGNQLTENDAFANDGDGIEVSGGTAASPNVLKKNRAGDRGKGNVGNGIAVAGDGSGKSNPVEIDENTAKANGQSGILITGSGQQLKKNTSGGSGSGEANGLCQFDVAAGNFNSTGNKANGVTVAGANGTPFPTGCLNP